MEELLSVKNIHMEYPTGKSKLVSIQNVSFDIHKNEFVSLIGPSGCGKSTILKMVLGLIKPTSGNIHLNGSPISENNLSRISVVFQNSALFPWLDVLKNVEIVLEPLMADRDERKETALKYIKMVGIDGFESAYPRELSGGMKQRVSIARAISTSPDLLLLDEPFAGLDVFSAQALREELLDLWLPPDKPPHAVLLVTHNVDEAVQLSDKIVILSKRPSTVIAERPIILTRPRNTRTEEFYNTVDEVIRTMSP
jgi:NitT/TauT family transport system ATP-binding protein